VGMSAKSMNTSTASGVLKLALHVLKLAGRWPLNDWRSQLFRQPPRALGGF